MMLRCVANSGFMIACTFDASDRETKAMLLSVAICTWNRAKLLDQTLTKMGELRIPDGVTWELLVVNNNCTDDTSRVVASAANALPVKEVFEKKLGQSHARNG